MMLGLPLTTFNNRTGYVCVRVGTKISMIYINDIYHDSIMIFLSENIMMFLKYFYYFQNINFYYYYLLTFLIDAYLIQTV